MSSHTLSRTRSRLSAIAGALVLVLGAAVVHGAGPTAHAAVAAVPPPLKVVTFNTCGQSACQSQLTSASAWAATIQQAVAAYSPDVVNLQELCDGQGQALAAVMTGYTFHYLQAVTLSPLQKGCVKWGGNTSSFGAGMLVKTSESPTFNDLVMQPRDPTVEPRPLICAEANDGGQPYQACDAHLAGDIGGYKAQGLPVVLNREQFWGGPGVPTVLAGDFNADPADPNLGLLYQAQDGNGSFVEAEQANRSYFTPSCRQLSACRSGEPTTLDTHRKFDYIFADSADFTVAAADTYVVTGASVNDHVMQRATLTWSHDVVAPSAPRVLSHTATVYSGNDWANAVDRTAGSFSGNGDSDMVLRYSDGTVMLYPSDGRGHFGVGRQLVSSAGGGWTDAASMTAGSFDGDGLGDGKADLLVRWNRGSVYLYPNDGNGNLGGSIPLKPVWSWSDAVDITAGRVLGGANSDVVIRWKDGSMTVSTMGRDSTGNYVVGDPQPLALGGVSTLTDVVDVTAGDFEGIGVADILVRHVDGTSTMYHNDGNGTFSQPGVTVTDGRDWKEVEDVTAGDFNHDGKDDVVLHWQNAYKTSDPGKGQTELVASTGPAAGWFSTTPLPLKAQPAGWWTDASDALVADVDGDGIADLIFRKPAGTEVDRGLGNGSFSKYLILGDYSWATGLAVGNFAADGSLGILAHNASVAGVYPFATGVPATGSVQPGVAGLATVDWALAVDIVAGHFYGSRYSDVVIRFTDGSVLLYRNTGGAFAAPVVVRPSGSGGWGDAATITAGDFDADGHDDLLVRWHAGSAFLYPGDGNGGFGGSVHVAAGGDFSDLVDVARGAIYGPSQGPKIFYRWADGSLVVDGTGNGDLASPASAAVSSTAPAVFTLRSSDDRGRVASFGYTLDGSTTPVMLDAFHNTLDITLTGLVPGAHTLSVFAVDPSGNRSATASYPFTAS